MAQVRNILADVKRIDAIETNVGHLQTEITNFDALPSQTGQLGKYLTTNGSVASWNTITQYTPPTNQGSDNFLSGDGTYKAVQVPTLISQLSNDSGYQTASQVSTAIAGLVNSAPSTLDTLNELATALGNDPNFATTVTNSIANKLSYTTLADGTGHGFKVGQHLSYYAIQTESTASGVYFNDSFGFLKANYVPVLQWDASKVTIKNSMYTDMITLNGSTGNVTATAFIGNGSQLTNLPQPDLSSYALTSTVNSNLALKADQSTTYTKTEVDTSLVLKADKNNVLSLNNTTPYSPSASYHPATKGYVDALASSGGGNVSITKGYSFTGNGSTTTFDCGSTNSYILGAIDIYYNGVQLDSTDYSAADGRYFTLTSLVPQSGDIIKLVAYGGADVYNKTQTDSLLSAKANLGGAAFTGPVSINSVVGIGISTPVGKFHTVLDTGRVNGNTWDSKTALFGGSGNNTVGALGISYDDTNGTRIESLSPQVAWKNLIINANSIDLRTNGNNDGLNVSSTGIITTPKQPSFCAYKSNDNNYTAYTGLNWTTTHNIGNCFNGVRFTAPVNGVYQFNFGGITHSVTNYFYIGFMINGNQNTQPASSSWRHLPQTDGEYNHLHTSMTVYLNVGDYVEAATGYNGGSPYLEAARSNFSGFLIG